MASAPLWPHGDIEKMKHCDQSVDPAPLLTPPPYDSPGSQQGLTTAEEVEWKTALCEFEDAATFCYGLWCCPCLSCTVSQKLGEDYCLPLCELYCCLVSALLRFPLVPPVALGLRVAMRKKYKIRGTLLKDIAVSCFCAWCSWCQMHRELKQQERGPDVVTVQDVVSVQPAPFTPMMNMNQVAVRQTTTVSTTLNHR